MKPGVYPFLTMEEYLKLPAFSAGLTNEILDRCPLAAWFASWMNPNRVIETNDASDAGSIAHAILLEGSEACCTVIDPKDHPAEKTGNIPDGWTNKSIRAARDAAREAGKIPVLAGDVITIRNMAASARAFIDTLRDSEPAIWRMFEPDGGESEVTMLWREGETLCRMRPDRIALDRGVICDAKFTKRSAEPDAWGRTLFATMGYYVSAAFYRRGIQALFGVACDYVFLNVEQEPPHLCSLVGVDPTAFALGDEKVAAGLREWQRCVSSGRWPAYPNRVCYPELPPWLATRWEEQQTSGRIGIPYDIAKAFERTDA